MDAGEGIEEATGGCCGMRQFAVGLVVGVVLGVLVCGALRAQWYSQADRRFTVCYYALEAK